MERLLNHGFTDKLSEGKFITYSKNFDTFTLLVDKHVDNKCWTLSVLDIIDDIDLVTDELDEVIISNDISFDDIIEMNKLFNKVCDE